MPDVGTDDQSRRALTTDLPSSIQSVPNRPCANSARKRRHIPNLSRSLASPSHDDKMLMMFQDAAVALEEGRSPRALASPNSGRSRVPLAQARLTRFGQSPWRHASPYSHRSPPKALTRSSSQSFRSTAADEHDDSEAANELCSGKSLAPEVLPSNYDNAETGGLDVLYPELPLTAHSVLSSEEHLETRVIMPISHVEAEEAQQLGINAWLDGLQGIADQFISSARQLAANDDRPAYPSLSLGKNDASSPSRDSSNKENISPAKSLSPICPPRTYISVTTPSRFRNLDFQSRPDFETQTPTRFLHPTTPQGHLSLPPRRYRAISLRSPKVSKGGQTHHDHISSEKASHPIDAFTVYEDADCKQSIGTEPTSVPRNSTIQDETQLTTALARLSPSVELQRKGRRGGARKNAQKRCTSYWDDDILEPGSPAYRSRQAGMQERGEHAGCLIAKDDIDADAGRAKDEGLKVLRNGRGVRVLGDSAESELLTREKPFVQAAEGCEFHWGS